MAAVILFKRTIYYIKEENELAAVLSKHTYRQRCLELIQIVLTEADGQIHRANIEYFIV